MSEFQKKIFLILPRAMIQSLEKSRLRARPLPSTHITETEMKAKNSLSRTKDADENNPWAANNLKRILGHRTFLVHTKHKFSHKKFRLNTYTPNHS